MISKEYSASLKSGSKAIANQPAQLKSGGKSMPAVSVVQRETGETEEEKQVESSQHTNKEEGWDIADDSDTVGVQISLPTGEQFAKQTNAGLFARRDDLLKMIDEQLMRCHSRRSSIYETEVWESKEENHASDKIGIRERMRQIGQRSRVAYKGELEQLQGLVNAWLSQFKDATDSGIARRRASVEALLPAIRSEQQMTTEQRVQSVLEKEAKAKATMELKARTLFTAEEFKVEAKMWMALPFTNISDVLSYLEAFHAIPESPGDDSIQLRKLEACQKVRSAASAANQDIVKLKEHAGYEKGHMDFEKKAKEARQTALQKFMSQCIKYSAHKRATEVKA